MSRFLNILLVTAIVIAGMTIYLFSRPTIHPYGVAELTKHVAATEQLIPIQQISTNEEIVSFKADNLREYALVEFPAGTAPGEGWPVVIVNHGRVEPKTYSTADYFKNVVDYFAGAGFLVVKPDYRGHGKSQGGATEEYDRGEYAVDVLNLIQGLKSLPGADTNQIFLFGHSMGADVSLQAAENYPNIKGMVLWAPAVNTYPLSFTYFDTPKADEPALSQLTAQYGTAQFSTLNFLSEVHSPILIQQSPTDEFVPFSWGENLTRALQEQAITVSFVSYPDDNHTLTKHSAEALAKDAEFFKSLVIKK